MGQGLGHPFPTGSTLGILVDMKYMLIVLTIILSLEAKYARQASYSRDLR